jgi:pentatricopeptide repeat protein
MHNDGITATTFTMNALIAVCARAGRTAETFQLFDDMQRAGVAVDVVTCNSLINSCVQSGNYQQVHV